MRITKKVAVAMSGGVDSSVAAALLKERGYEVVGITMEIWDGNDLFSDGTCHACYGPEGEDIEDARTVARTLGIPFYSFDLRQEYKTVVLSYVSQEYHAGRTPNPCVRCNRRIKFDVLLRKARQSGIEFDYFATGHYANVEHDKQRSRYVLKKAKDLRKDQSYFLVFLSQEQLECSRFPVGDFTKEEVRKLASRFKLPVAVKPESQDFMSGGYYSLIRPGVPAGPIIDTQGNILGQHRGIPFYTIGQRRGLGISAREPLYVIAVDSKRNALIVGGKDEVYGDVLVASGLNWIALRELAQPIEVSAKIRYSHKESEAVVEPLDRGRVYVRFKEPQMAITPGQVIAFYDNDTVVGGGTIESAGI